METLQNMLSVIKPLTLNQYDGCKDIVKNRIRKMNGEKPTREKLKREQTSLFTPLDWLALIVFVAAFMVSSLHIIDHVGDISEGAYQSVDIGLMRHISKDSYVTISQLGMIFLAEASMLLFMTAWRMEVKHITKIHKKATVTLFLAILAMLFVLVANISSGLSPLEALMPPLFTIGLGFQLEKITFLLLDRREQLSVRYREKIQQWETTDEEPEKYEAYRLLLMREVWDKLSRLKDNKEFQDVPKNIRMAAVEREMERDSWAIQQIQIQAAIEDTGAVAGEMPEDDLERLQYLVKKASLKDRGVIDCGRFIADLDTKIWRDQLKNKTYGPYKKKGSMMMSITMLLNRRSKKSVVEVNHVSRE